MDYLYATEYKKDGRKWYGNITAPTFEIAQIIGDSRTPPETVVGVISLVEDVDDITGNRVEIYRDGRVDEWAVPRLIT
jgi:hypothetical protein